MSGSETESPDSRDHHSRKRSPENSPTASKSKESQALDSQDVEVCSIRDVEAEQRPKSPTIKFPPHLLTPVRMEDYDDDESDECGDREVPPSVSEIQVRDRAITPSVSEIQVLIILKVS
jgi:hypothetical protein